MQETKEISAYKQGLRSRILDTAMRSFGEMGIRAVKMDDVATRLGISKRTLYELFENKELLLYEGVRKAHEESKQALLAQTAGCGNVMEILLLVFKTKMDEFRQTNPQFFSDLVKYPKVARYLNQENQHTRKDTLKFLERGIYEGYFQEDMNVELVARLFDALGRYVMVNQLYRQYSIDDIFRNVVLVSLRGICTERGAKELDKMT